jgi:hypothetical protein
MVKRFWKASKGVDCKEAAEIIRRFVSGNSDEYEWDDFETANQENPQVELAILLCWYFAAKFPARNSTEYCDPQADRYFLRIADALERGFLKEIEFEKVKQELKAGNMEESLRKILSLGEEITFD